MLKLIPPGERKNKFWLVRGTLDGFRIEKSLSVSLRKDAEKALRELLTEYETGKYKNENITFNEAAERFIAFRNPSDRECRFIECIRQEIGHTLCAEINQDRIVKTANALYPSEKTKAATKNRAVIRPLAAVLHYAAKNKWCDWLRVDTFREAAPITRYVTDEVETKLLAATTGMQLIFILWAFRQGNRISDILRVTWADINLGMKTVNHHISKSDRYITLPLDDEICLLLSKINNREGELFPWRNRWAVYEWLTPLRTSLGVEFTPHRARHTLGKRMNDNSAGLRTIMQALGQSNVNSAIRYQTTDVETIRLAKQKVGKVGGI